MPKIVHLINDTLIGGAQMSLCKLLSNMNRSRFDFSVISLGSIGPIKERIEALGVPVYNLGIRNRYGAVFSAPGLVRLVRKLDPDIIHGWMYHGNIAALIAAAFMHIPVLWSIRHSLHDIGVEKRYTAWLIKMGAYFSSYPACVLYNSRVAALHHESAGYDKSRSFIIPNGFDCETFRPDPEAYQSVRRELQMPSDALLIGLIARYHPMKDHEGFLKAASLVSECGFPVRFLLAGHEVDEHNSMLRRQISAFNLRDYVYLLGERTDIPRLTAALDIAVSSSRTGEGFSNTIGEAMACGVPCVVTDVGDSAEIIGSTGRVVPPGKPEELAHACKELIELGPGGRHALGMAARERIIGHFSLSKVAGQYEDLYIKVLERPRAK